MTKRLACEGRTFFCACTLEENRLDTVSHCKGTEFFGNIQIFPYYLTFFHSNTLKL